ncbi:alpha/beta fold hydrolase [Alkalihalobacillus sp. AL-G]|uniref:alpha/beta fold hydrolase n=1 Tax=Alkalihalobacillus sp. AL-G TaxID=2926399 RepID=UPI00272B5DD6|nr:alpha/beta fold hydrolase [Alkalihalobacillus sp. AL-G]WLD92864.1 alpha/beta fold hydrolase [Alkalihalobacillus sp. AL-G]
MKEFRKIVDNYTFHGYESGDGNLPSIVCLHGMTGDSKSFLGLNEYLKNNFHLIFLDLPGHGETSSLKLEEDYKFSSLVKRIYSVIQKVTNEPFYILGHSWGADLSLNFAVTYPDKIKGVILIDGGYVFPEHVVDMAEERALSDWIEYIKSSTYKSWDQVINTYQEYTTKQWDAQLNSIISSNFKKNGSNYVLSADRLSLLATIKAFYHEPCSATYNHIKCPVLLFHSTIPDIDPSRNRGIKKIKESIKNVQVIGIANTKHNIHWDNPERVASEILTWSQDEYSFN